MIQIVPVSGSRMLKAFIDYPHELYRHDPCYVPELFVAQRDLLSPGKHPFYKHSSLQLFLAYRDGRIAGRIAAILNNNHNRFNNTQDGFFGFFDCEEDPLVSAKLFETAEKWLRQKQANTIIGPVNFSTNETCGMLLEGYDSPPVAMMTYNKPYYNHLAGQYGFRKKTDLLAYHIDARTCNDKSLALMKPLRERLHRNNIIFRKVDMKQFSKEVAGLREVYNKAWDKNLGFVPMTDEEFDYLAKDLKLILDPDFCLVAEHNGQAIGFSLCIPDINQVLIKIKRGRLLPTGIFKLLTQRKSINSVRVIALGVLQEYRKKGIEAVFYSSLIEQALKKNIQKAEASWILEDNFLMNKAIQNINGVPYKRYRIYEKELE